MLRIHNDPMAQFREAVQTAFEEETAPGDATRGSPTSAPGLTRARAHFDATGVSFTDDERTRR